ncbi:nuclear respiratory factor 1 isoform X2 [Aquila chrysaetos chrysaetos]|uniref:nuclear respiratory factor 1 isoform X2 n=2 Tax=Accipitrinae TaxID=8955 RepID=UPI001B7D3C93|nr:nuclear respiratory factor 1 isoform X2 [Aquila chrysaetos chrysaetos]
MTASGCYAMLVGSMAFSKLLKLLFWLLVRSLFPSHRRPLPLGELLMEEHGVTQTEHMATIEAHAVAQQVQQVHVATYTEHSMLSADEDSPSSPEDTSYDDSDILNSTAADEVTAHLAAAGPVGMAAAAAVATGKKRKRPHVFESNPSIRKRQQTRLLRKLRATLDEYTTRVGQQAIVLCISPSKPNPVFKVFGAAPLENVVRKYKSMILEDLESALAEHAPAPQEVNSELPPLTIDGIPVSVDKMTQAQLRAFIPEMLKYSTGRGKPGWGKESCKPIWWPEDIPWANVRSDVRTEEQKQRVSWTQALRTIVKNCYKQHGREDLLYAFEDQQTQQQTTTTHSIAHLVPSQTVVQTFSNPDGTVSLIQVGTGATVATLADASELPTTVTVAQVNYSAVTDGEGQLWAQENEAVALNVRRLGMAKELRRVPALLVPKCWKTRLAAAEECVIADVEQNWATLQGGEMTIQTTQASEATQAVASLAEAAVAASQEMQQGATVTMALNSEAAAHAVATLAEATLQGGGQIVLSGETAAAVGALTGVQDANGFLAADYSGYKWSLAESSSGLVQIPVSMYQTVVTSLAQGNGPVQVAMAPVTTRIADSAVTMDGQAVEVVTLEQ